MDQIGVILLGLLIIFLGIQTGGGLYESRVVYPLWGQDPTPATLIGKLKSSGQEAAGRRFWPFVSPVVFLLGLANIVIGWHVAGPAGVFWLSAALIVVLKSLTTYGYFVPTMIRKLYNADKLPPPMLSRTVHLWTRLSTIRSFVAVLALVLAVMALARVNG